VYEYVIENLKLFCKNNETMLGKNISCLSFLFFVYFLNKGATYQNFRKGELISAPKNKKPERWESPAPPIHQHDYQIARLSQGNPTQDFIICLLLI
jgi:hypothetical protein